MFKRTKLCKYHEISSFASFFVSLQAGMKNIFTSISALLLVVWYSLSVIGFDVHTCNASGEIYIATVAGGFSCDDIHPDGHKQTHHEHSCCKCCQSHQGDSDKLKTKPCCTDDYQVILLTGVRSAQDAEDSYQQTLVETINIAESDYSYSHIFDNGLRAFYKPGSGGLTPRDVQAVYNIWRI